MTKEKFLDNMGTWDNHRALLWQALELTKDSKLPVIEYGAGDGSTPYLRQYCLDANREFISYESNKEWAEKCGSVFIEDWMTADIYKDYSVVLVDCAPGEVRHEIMAVLKDKAEIIVVHDSEDAATGYMMYKVWPLFVYRKNYNKNGGGAESSMVSNKINVNA